MQLRQPLNCMKRCTQRGGASPLLISSVSKSDVRQAIKGGQTFQENFEASYGPSIYAVNEHYIKPVTAAAGKMSWALMMNPDGLDCDLFITHAWQEGVFEFTQKVLTSWPWRASHAWCCMLANPQNLGYWCFASIPIIISFCTCTSKFQIYAGGAQPAQKCLHEVVVRI